MRFLRNSTVNVLRYLPGFLSEDESFKAVQDALSEEHEKLRLELDNLGDQFFLTISGETGIAGWERVIGLIPDADDTLDDRRRAVLLWLQSNQVSTLEFMSRLVARYVEDGNAWIEEVNEEYRFYLVIDMQSPIINRKGLDAAVEMYKPAHLGYDRLYTTTRGIVIGHAVLQYAYTPPKCNTLLCGTWPRQATLGWTVKQILATMPKVTILEVRPELTGTLPWIKTKGWTVRGTLRAGATVMADGYEPYEANTLLTGIKPKTATLGRSVTGTLRAGGTVSGLEVKPELTGTLPGTKTVGISIEGAVQSKAAVKESVYKIEPAGTLKTGEEN